MSVEYRVDGHIFLEYGPPARGAAVRNANSNIFQKQRNGIERYDEAVLKTKFSLFEAIYTLGEKINV